VLKVVNWMSSVEMGRNLALPPERGIHYASACVSSATGGMNSALRFHSRGHFGGSAKLRPSASANNTTADRVQAPTADAGGGSKV
jgi:hypothetical protein